MQKKMNCTIIALAMTMVLGVVDIHAVCVPCQDVVDDVLDRACNEFAASPPNSESALANTAVEIFNGILLDTELCDDEQAYRSSAAVCQENLLSQLGVSEAASASMPEPRLGPELDPISVPEPEPEPEPRPEPEPEPEPLNSFVVINYGKYYPVHTNETIEAIPITKDLPPSKIMLNYGDCSVPYDRVARDGNIDSLVDSPVDYGYYYNQHIYKPENERLLRYSESGIVTLDYVFCRITIINDELTIEHPLPEPEPEPEIVWYWADAETGNERGTFTTNGELVDGNASSGSYEITDFTVTATTTSLPTTGSYAGGQWNAGAPVGFLWDGNGPTQFWRSGGNLTNGLSFYPSPLPVAGIANRIAMSIDFFVIDEYYVSTEVQQSATIVLSVEPLAEPEPQAAVRVRKEIHTLTVEERTLFTQTYRQAWDAPDSELKQMADEFLTNFSRGLHNNGAFLPWHRGYLLQVENQLRDISPNITIPYWDWSRNPQISQDSIWGDEPGQFSGNGGADRCVTDGPFGTGSGFELTNGRCLQRRITGGSAASAAEVQNLLDRYPSASDYDQFRNRLEHGPGMHDSVHCLVGGTMCSARASNDPVFFLHHAMVDKIWADWQGQSEEHRSAYTGDTSRDGLMPVSPYTPVDLLDMRHLPGADGGFVEVRYEESQ